MPALNSYIVKGRGPADIAVLQNAIRKGMVEEFNAPERKAQLLTGDL